MPKAGKGVVYDPNIRSTPMTPGSGFGVIGGSESNRAFTRARVAFGQQMQARRAMLPPELEQVERQREAANQELQMLRKADRDPARQFLLTHYIVANRNWLQQFDNGNTPPSWSPAPPSFENWVAEVIRDEET